MNNRKAELKKIKKYELHSSWYVILALTVVFIVWLLIIYLVAIFENRYSNIHNMTFALGNDIAISIATGLISGILAILFAFIFLDIIKRMFIKDYFSYYSYLNSLRNKIKFTFLKDSKIPSDLYKKNIQPLTKTAFISLVANILDYSVMSPNYSNLIYEINTDFALHSYLSPNFSSQRKIALTRIIIIDIIIPLAIQAILLLIIIYAHKRSLLAVANNDLSISAITRILIIILTTVFSVMISIIIYEFYILGKVKNYNSFNDFYFLSFNNYQFKFLNSSLIKR